MSDPAAPERTNALVIGAGPAGLAVAACLQRAGVPHLLLEAAESIVPAWRRHYDRLHLHTPASQSELPYLKYPTGYPRYPSRDQFIGYLERYAAHFELNPRCGEEVAAAYRLNGEWHIETTRGLYTSSALVAATGLNAVPNLPAWEGSDHYKGKLIHSSEYRSGAPFRGQEVLVVGFGNSGGEIAIDLTEHGANASLSVRSPVNVIPRDLAGIPIVTVALWTSFLPNPVVDAIFEPVLAYVARGTAARGLRRQRYGPTSQIARTARIPLIDVGTLRLIRKGRVKVYPDVARLTERGVVFGDGTERTFDAVIAATGYRPRLDFLRGAEVARWQSDPMTIPINGQQAAIPSLYFCGFNVRATGMLREIAIEARNIARQIAA